MAAAETAVEFPWALCLALDDASSLSALRLTVGIEVAEVKDSLWVRGQKSGEELHRKLAALPARARYEWLPPNQLRALEQRIPSARMPDAAWQRLDAWLQVEVPSSALPAERPAAVGLRLVRSSDEREAELLQTSVDELAAYAATAPQIRLAPLQFAARSDGSVFVRGTPLPPVPGERFVLHGSLAVPSGWHWQPAVGVAAVVRSLGIPEGALVVWHSDGTLVRLHAEQWVPFSRAALRATRKAFAETP